MGKTDQKNKTSQNSYWGGGSAFYDFFSSSQNTVFFISMDSLTHLWPLAAVFLLHPNSSFSLCCCQIFACAFPKDFAFQTSSCQLTHVSFSASPPLTPTQLSASLFWDGWWGLRQGCKHVGYPPSPFLLSLSGCTFPGIWSVLEQGLLLQPLAVD